MIGEGNTAEVYSWKEGKILKLFRKEFPLGGIDKEYKVNKEVEMLGLPIPKAEEIIEYNGRSGIVYERITGESLLKLISKQPWAARKYVKQLVRLQYEMHQCKAENLGSYKEAMEWNIRHTDALSDNMKQTILRRLDQLPEGDILCHGDFHPGNIIKSNEDYIVLDWMTAAVGSPGMDVARTALLLKDAALPGNIPVVVKIIINGMRGRMLRYYLRYYRKRSGISQEEIDRWRLPIIAARLAEWIPDTERNTLLKEIEGSLS
ncbi:MAG: hypothetical protein K0R34_2760 [Herbinix sp.]|nr:hypothetical protein [Herbinix sp.]